MSRSVDDYHRGDNTVQYTRPSSAPSRGRVEPSAERRLHIAMLAPPWIPIPPPGYGGIEFVVALLCDALVDLNHDVELFCAPGSRSRATVHPLLDAPHPESIERALFEADHVGRAFRAIDAAAENGAPFDVVHDHCGYTPLAMADRLDTPLVHTPMLGGSLPLSTFEDVLGAPLITVPIVNHDNNQHAANENLRLQNLWDGIAIYAAVMAGFGGTR